MVLAVFSRTKSHTTIVRITKSRHRYEVDCISQSTTFPKIQVSHSETYLFLIMWDCVVESYKDEKNRERKI